MTNDLDDLISQLYRRMHKALDFAIQRDQEENYEGDLDDYDGLSETQLDELVSDLVDDITAGLVIESDEYSLLEILTATKSFLQSKGEGEGFWTYDTVSAAISELGE